MSFWKIYNLEANSPVQLWEHFNTGNGLGTFLSDAVSWRTLDLSTARIMVVHVTSMKWH
jgi:hypothetical protein